VRRREKTDAGGGMRLQILTVEGPNKGEWEKVGAYFSQRRGVGHYRATSASEAMRLLRAENIGIVLADYNLPRVNPLNFLGRIKALKPHVEVIFLSEQTSLTRAIEAMREGAYDFYEFPLNMRLLMTVIDKAAEKQALFFEKMELEERVKERFDFGSIVGRSKAIDHVLGIVRTVAPRNINVLITGETGTGKELIASSIHYHSPRAARPLIKVNCAAFNVGVLESELFGHEKGAFTGAIAQRVGRFELADGGTIFLDEIGDVSPSTQIKLLRVLQEKEFERVGGNDSIKVDVRIIAATNQILRKLVEEGRFREDLYYRLNVVHLEMPPLRERKGDIPLLVTFFINKLNEEKGYQIRGISKDAMRILLDYSWPGNVRELENAVESAMALAEGRTIEAKYLPAFLLLGPSSNGDFYHIPRDLPLGEIENEVIRLTLERTHGNRTQAARQLGIGLRTLQRKLKAAR